MSRIKILPENLANRIAAGEVVERPASVVKEFVENAIDAHAGHVTVQVEGGGSRLIRVIDDGEGMEQDDVLLSLERHATSKLADEAQLSAISTLGFRGEAMPSIASVSRLTITSRPASAELGVRAEVRFGQVVRVHEVGCARGTVIEVRDLFGNMPARRKFLKTVHTELFHIEEVVKNYALAYPQLGFAYGVNGREVFNLSAAVYNLEARVRQLVCRARNDATLLRLGQESCSGPTEGVCKVHGYLLPPDQSAALGGSGARLRLFVNGRAVRDRMIGNALAEGLRGYLMKGARPVGVLFVEVPPDIVDVNVHPTKQEVRFLRPKVIFQLVNDAAAAAMERYQRSLKRELFVLPDRPARPPLTTGRPSPPERPPVLRSAEPEPDTWGAPATENTFTSVALPLEPAPSVGSGRGEGMPSERSHRLEPAPTPSRSTSGGTGAAGDMPVGHLRPVGQLLDTYILCQSEEGLVVIDQHAVHERLLFESLKNQFTARAVARQTLLFPAVVEMSPEESRLVERHGAEISALGVDIEPFGGDSYVVKAVPAIVAHLGAETIVRDLLDRLATGSGAMGIRVEAVLASMACKAAIKAGDPLQEKEVAELLRQMREADVFSHCPHGRPVMKHFTGADIRRWFHRG